MTFVLIAVQWGSLSWLSTAWGYFVIISPLGAKSRCLFGGRMSLQSLNRSSLQSWQPAASIKVAVQGDTWRSQALYLSLGC